MRSALAITILAVALALPAAALTTTWSPNSTYGPAALDWSGATIALEQWDTLTGVSWDPATSGGGTVTGAEIYLQSTLSGNNTWVLTVGTDQTVTMHQEATISLLPPGGGSSLVNVLPTQTDTWTHQTAQANGTQTLSGSDNGTASFSGSALSPFIGTGNATCLLNSNDFHYGTSSGSGGGTFSSTFAAQADAVARIRYTYTEDIPEPGTLALVGFGLVGLLALRRRKKS